LFGQGVRKRRDMRRLEAGLDVLFNAHDDGLVGFDLQMGFHHLESIIVPHDDRHEPTIR
jgi:hypothetical protein